MRILRLNVLFSAMLGICVCTHSASAQTTSSSSSSSASSSYSTSSSPSQFAPVDMRMSLSGVSVEKGNYIVKEIAYGDVEAFDWEKGLYGANLLDKSAYTANAESSGDNVVINLSLPSFLAGHNNVTIVAGYANSPTLCNDYIQVSANFRNAVSNYGKGASSVETVFVNAKAGKCSQSGVSLILSNSTERGFSKYRPTAPNNDPDTIEKYYKTYFEWDKKIETYLSNIGLKADQIESLCKENGCYTNSTKALQDDPDAYVYPYYCRKTKLTWVAEAPASKTSTKWKLSAECICIDETHPDT